ncbi:Uncharacterized protein dnm_047270 [Desulfonema magnum]|uniref:Uncharacterized protein n=1 Tax=Desulfonema magnum TaxID=45655 RepID=A0A975GPD5_9BACT|nr:Uncharacterized protein dnm_047270 [Desulfonema magnum]
MGKYLKNYLNIQRETCNILNREMEGIIRGVTRCEGVACQFLMESVIILF